MQSKLILIILTAILFWILVVYVPYGTFIILPINLFVTFLHEFGHSLFAILTGGSVNELLINANGSGHAVTAGGFLPLILMGGYIGSAIFGNLLLKVGLKNTKFSIFTLYIIIIASVFSAIWWYSSLFTSSILILFAAGCFWLTKESKNMVSNLLIIIGTSSITYILLDYNNGPSSDLAKFTEMIPILPKTVWAIVWLLLVAFITYKNLKSSFKKA